MNSTDQAIWDQLSPALQLAMRRIVLSESWGTLSGPTQTSTRTKSLALGTLTAPLVATALVLGFALGSALSANGHPSKPEPPASSTSPSEEVPQPDPVATTTTTSGPTPLDATTSTTTSSTSGGPDYLGLKIAAEGQLKGKLDDAHGVRYRNVQTYLSTLDGSGIVAFCGEENSRTALGGYGGFRRFIASQSTAVTEDVMAPDDFATAWQQFCSKGVPGPQVWF